MIEVNKLNVYLTWFRFNAWAIAWAPASPISLNPRLSVVSVCYKYRRLIIEVNKLNVYLTWFLSNVWAIACAPAAPNRFVESSSVVSVYAW